MTRKSKPAGYDIRCTGCGYTCSRFHGWVFIADTCREANKPSMFHKWEVVETGANND